MPTKGRIPRFLGLFILAFAFVGVVSFQILKDRRIATAAITEKVSQLEINLKEQTRMISKREEERNFAQSKLLELERVSQSALEALHAKERELESMVQEHKKTVDEVIQLKKIVQQKEGEIVSVRGQLQEFSFEKAKENAQQFESEKQRQEIEERQVEENKPADEAGIGDRTRLQEEEERANDMEDVTATEQEMYERSEPKEGAKVISTEAKIRTEGLKRDDDVLKLDSLEDEETEEQDNADTRDLDGKDIDISQDDDLNELHTGDHEETDRQQHADHNAE